MIAEYENIAMERMRSENYLRHAESLLEIAEESLVSKDGELISIKGITKLRDKIARIKASQAIAH